MADETLRLKDETAKDNLAAEIARTYNTGFFDGLIIGMHISGCSDAQIIERLHIPDDKLSYLADEIAYYKDCLEDEPEFLGECPAKWVEPQQ